MSYFKNSILQFDPLDKSLGLIPHQRTSFELQKLVVINK